jgi:Na+/melibiose symporter-like transporter
MKRDGSSSWRGWLRILGSLLTFVLIINIISLPTQQALAYFSQGAAPIE